MKHHGTAASHAPSVAPADITVDWSVKGTKTRILVEVSQTTDEKEFTSIVSHLNDAVGGAGSQDVFLLYSGRSISVRFSRFIRNENLRREKEGAKGRIIYAKLNDLQEIVEHWTAAPKEVYPIDGLQAVFNGWRECTTETQAYRHIQATLFPDWSDKAESLTAEVEKNVAYRQERLRKDILKLENKLRESGVTGNAAHKTLIFLFFAALYEDKRGENSRMTKEGFIAYRSGLSAKDQREFKDRTVHHLLTHHIAEDLEIKSSGMMNHYEPIQLTDAFVIDTVIPVFESYPLSAGGMDFIGAVFEALARRAEKDNRIGQFFTPETAVLATCRLANLTPTDVVLDPACGTGRFLIHAMGFMLAKSGTVPGQAREDVERSIKEDGMLGSDIDPWVATIAKMNMYLHGDGKSNIKCGNGLALSTGTPFAPRVPPSIGACMDVVLTNPPLGDVNFSDAAHKLAQAGLLGEVSAPEGSAEHARAIQTLANDWTSKRLSVVPHTCVEERGREKHQESLSKWDAKLRKAIADSDEKAEKRCVKGRDDVLAKLQEVNERIGRRELTFEPAGSTAKGGALFLSAILDYLKPVRNAGAEEEWKGGTVGIVLDEAILNTPSYQRTREFIAENFFIKAVISLPRDAFEFLAKTTAKTSILVLTKKPDTTVVQREPIFYAKAEVIGYTSSGVTERNDLAAIVDAFGAWRTQVAGCYRGALLDAKKAATAAGQISKDFGRVFFYPLSPADKGERLDFSYRRMRDVVAKLPNPVRLGDLCESVVRTPDPQEVYNFAYVSSADGRVRDKGPQTTSYTTKDLRKLKGGDLLLSGIDVVKGAVGVVARDCNGLVVSKEFYTLVARKDAPVKVLPEYIACVLRSPLMLEIIEGTVTGVSNRTRIEDIASFLELPIPQPAGPAEQKEIADKLKSAYKAQDRAAKALEDIEASVLQRPKERRL